MRTKITEKIIKTIEELKNDLDICLNNYDLNGYDWRVIKCFGYWGQELLDLSKELKEFKKR